MLKRSPQKGKDRRLEKIAQITGIPIKSLQRVSLEELARVKIDKKFLNLLHRDFLENIKRKQPEARVIGPIESGPYTIIARIKKVNFSRLSFLAAPKRTQKEALAKASKKSRDAKSPKKKEEESYNKKTDSSLTKSFLDYLIEEEVSPV